MGANENLLRLEKDRTDGPVIFPYQPLRETDADEDATLQGEKLRSFSRP